MSEFKKLDDLPKGRPNTYDEVMKAMAALHKGVMKQSHLYGGKNSKLYIPQVVETSLMKSIAGDQDEVQFVREGDEAERLMDLAHSTGEALADHLKANNDDKALGMLSKMLKYTGLALKAHGSPEK